MCRQARQEEGNSRRISPSSLAVPAVLALDHCVNQLGCGTAGCPPLGCDGCGSAGCPSLGCEWNTIRRVEKARGASSASGLWSSPVRAEGRRLRSDQTTNQTTTHALYGANTTRCLAGGGRVMPRNWRWRPFACVRTRGGRPRPGGSSLPGGEMSRSRVVTSGPHGSHMRTPQRLPAA